MIVSPTSRSRVDGPIQAAQAVAVRATRGRSAGERPKPNTPVPNRRSATLVYAQRGTPRTAADLGGAAEAWISGVVGLVFLYLGQRFGGWLLATLSGHAYQHGVQWQPPHPNAGQLVPYWSVDPRIFSALSDCSLFVFGVALLFEAAVLLMLAGRGGRLLRPAVAVTLLTTLLATLLNAATVAYFFQHGLGLALMSLLAVAFGGYMCTYLFRTWSLLGRVSRAGRA